MHICKWICWHCTAQPASVSMLAYRSRKMCYTYGFLFALPLVAALLCLASPTSASANKHQLQMHHSHNQQHNNNNNNNNNHHHQYGEPGEQQQLLGMPGKAKSAVSEDLMVSSIRFYISFTKRLSIVLNCIDRTFSWIAINNHHVSIITYTARPVVIISWNILIIASASTPCVFDSSFLHLPSTPCNHALKHIVCLNAKNIFTFFFVKQEETHKQAEIFFLNTNSLTLEKWRILKYSKSSWTLLFSMKTKLTEQFIVLKNTRNWANDLNTDQTVISKASQRFIETSHSWWLQYNKTQVILSAVRI